MPRIEFVGVSKRYDSGDGLATTDLVIDDGALATIVGPSGSGKSTVLRLIAGLEQPDAGEVRFDDVVVNDVPPALRGLGLVVADGALYGARSAAQNLAFPLEVTHVERRERERRVGATAGRFRLRHILSRKARELSAGQRQLVATGRATIRQQSLILFDEALAGIDPHQRASVREQLRALHAGGHTVVYATNHQDEAMALGTQTVLLRGGRVEQVGTPDDLYRRPTNRFVAEFFGEPGMNILTVERLGDDRIVFGADTVLADVPPDSGHRVLAGIRPEHVSIAPAGTPFAECFHARVTHIENLGHARLVHVAFGTPDSGSTDFVFRTLEHGLRPGDDVELTFDQNTISFFDRWSGERLQPVRA